MARKHNKNKSFSIGSIATVKKYGKKLGFASIFNRFKSKNDKLSKFVNGLVSHKIHFDQSIHHASKWLNQEHILQEFSLHAFVPKTLYRMLETIGRHDKSVMTMIQNRLNQLYAFENTDINIDWSSLTLYGNKAEMTERGYSREGKPDKKQITFGVSELREFNIPIALTVQAGNVLDKQHFPKTFKRTLKALDKGSLVIIDRGAVTQDNKNLIRAHKHHYLCAKSLSKKIDEKIESFDKKQTVIVDEREGKKVYCLKYSEDSEYKFLFFSEKLYDDTMKRKSAKVKKKLADSKELQRRIISGRKYKRKTYQLPDFVATESLELQKRITNLTEEELSKRLLKESTNGREGFFLLTSSKNLTEDQVLKLYRSRDTIEKLIDSLKNVIRIKPVRVWTDNAIIGALIVGFLAQLIIALFKYEHKKLKKLHPKTIVESIKNLTLTIEHIETFVQNRIISNIDEINQLIFLPKKAGT